VKKIFLLLIPVMGVMVQLSAQPIILKTGDMPAVNTVIESAPVVYDSVSTVNLGNTGGPQTWNFSNVPTEPFTSFIYYIDTAQTPYTGDYPGANLCSVYDFEDSTEYSYYLSTPAEFSQMGISDPENNIKFGQPFKGFELPFTYTNNFSQNVSISGVSEGLTLSGSAKTTVKADAFGTVIIPAGTFPALRVYRITEISATVLFFSIVQRDTVWEWWTNQFQAPVMSYHRSYLSALGEEEYDVYADMFVAQTVADKEPAAPNKIDLQITPNPTAGITTLRFDLPVAGKADIQVFDASGKIIRRESLGRAVPGEQTVDFDLSAASKGVYYVMLRQRGKMLGIKQLIKQ